MANSLNRALINIGLPAVEQLIAALKADNKQMRQYAAFVLGEIKDLRAVEPLIAAFKDSDKDVRQEAAQAISKIGPSIVTPFQISGSRVRPYKTGRKALIENLC